MAPRDLQVEGQRVLCYISVPNFGTLMRITFLLETNKRIQSSCHILKQYNRTNKRENLSKTTYIKNKNQQTKGDWRGILQQEQFQPTMNHNRVPQYKIRSKKMPKIFCISQSSQFKTHLSCSLIQT